jgi:hypothetical protein
LPSTPFETMLASTLDFRGPEVVDQLYRSHPLSAWLKANKRVKEWEGGGENIEQIIKIGRNGTFAARDYKEQLQFTETNPLDFVEIPSRFINGHITWYNAQEESNQGKFKIIDFVNELIDDGQQSMSDVMALEFWQGGTGEHLHGLPAILSASNTYMGLLRTTAGNEFWRAKTGASYTFDSVTYGPFNSAEPFVIEGGTDGGIRGLYNACCDNGGTDGPDFGITSEALYNKLVALIGAERVRYNEKMAEIGYPENIQFRGATIVWDRFCGAAAGTPDATTFAFLNSKYLALRPYKGYGNSVKKTAPFSLNPVGLQAKSVIISWRGNLVCKKPQRCGMLTGKTV